ncbi:tyrosine-type recombinase/integrase [Tychonema sp. LEGE 06208]|uniref:tyrosine-type recombinase/integrase n=1 Tax=Tychonema sp. LEGE 06208 TaxID=1828663 RepID=UPI00187E63BA|nr:tyrosine-type recombinase/integrase [Tychonema sp. LEGE 06208]MBE9163486.1 tyrosine-type recombinase/integrase [Tychonema sp. LEGE 06208]
MQVNKSQRRKKGTVGVMVSRGLLRLHLPRELYGGKNKFVCMGLPDTLENRAIAECKAKQIELDILTGMFDPNDLSKYKPVQLHKHSGNLVQAKFGATSLTLQELWDKYLNYKQNTLKPKSLHYLQTTLGRHIAKCPSDILQALEVREVLLGTTTGDMTKRILTHLNAAVSWGIKHRLITLPVSPYKDMANDLPKYNWQNDPAPNGFVTEEKLLVLQAFESHKNKPGHCYHTYYPLVKFWFLTGCRPSEAIGLTWGNISPDCSYVLFNGSIQFIEGKAVESKGSKNNKHRKFPCNNELKEFLVSIRPQQFDSKKIVFSSPTGDVINYSNFSQRAWHKIVVPITDKTREPGYKPTTPYSCRDTFISEQLAQGIPSAVIARWCDTSESIINSHYLDNKILEHLRPL